MTRNVLDAPNRLVELGRDISTVLIGAVRNAFDTDPVTGVFPAPAGIGVVREQGAQRGNAGWYAWPHPTDVVLIPSIP